MGQFFCSTSRLNEIKLTLFPHPCTQCQWGNPPCCVIAFWKWGNSPAIRIHRSRLQSIGCCTDQAKKNCKMVVQWKSVGRLTSVQPQQQWMDRNSAYPYWTGWISIDVWPVLLLYGNNNGNCTGHAVMKCCSVSGRTMKKQNVVPMECIYIQKNTEGTFLNQQVTEFCLLPALAL